MVVEADLVKVFFDRQISNWGTWDELGDDRLQDTGLRQMMCK